MPIDLRARHRDRKQQARESLGERCASCGSPERLEFDHVDPATKRKAIADMPAYSDDAFWREVAKCQLLCRPCHLAKQSAGREFRTQNAPGPAVVGARHATRTGYRHDNCRCQPCRDANAAYFRTYRETR